MSDLTRWTIACTAGLSAVCSTLFAWGYSTIERNNATWQGVELTLVVRWFHALAPAGVALAAVMLVVAIAVAARRNTDVTVAMSSINALFAFVWVLLCIFVWRTPYLAIGARVGPM